jgi:hypothetical protein
MVAERERERGGREGEREGDGRINPPDFTLRSAQFSPSSIPKIIVFATFMLTPQNYLPLSF